MKCSKCGKSFKDIKGIAAHYRKAHPGAMKARNHREKGFNEKGQADWYVKESKPFSIEQREKIEEFIDAALRKAGIDV
jgi:uncharacterized C2H2 Zn-finger protein